MNMNQLMKQAKKMQEDMEKTQEELQENHNELRQGAVLCAVHRKAKPLTGNKV